MDSSPERKQRNLLEIKDLKLLIQLGRIDTGFVLFNTDPAAAKSAVGIGTPDNDRGPNTRPRVFLCPRIMVGWVLAPLWWPVSIAGSSNQNSVCHPNTDWNRMGGQNDRGTIMADPISNLNAFGVNEQIQQKLMQLEGIIATSEQSVNTVDPALVAAALFAAESIIQELQQLNQRGFDLLPRTGQ